MGYFLVMELQEDALYIQSLIQQKLENHYGPRIPVVCICVRKDQLLETDLKQSWHANVFCVVHRVLTHTAFFNEL